MRIPILDHGFIEVVEHWGSDERIIEAARMSTGKGFLGWDPGVCPTCVGTCSVEVEEPIYHAGTTWSWEGEGLAAKRVCTPPPTILETSVACPSCNGKGKIAGDAKLLAFLYANWHHTPFEMAGMIVEVQAPIMVFREWHRHRTQGYNEMSARYAPLPDVNYIPTPARCMLVSGSNKQAGAVAGASLLTHETAISWLEQLADVYAHAERVYQAGLAAGIPKELARLPVPVGRYSRMRATACLRNLLAFLTLRSDHALRGSAAQWEIRQFANAVGDAIAARFPRTWELFVEQK